MGTFNGIGDCIMKTVRASGITGLYRGWSITVAGAFVYRAGQLGTFAQIMAMNPYKEDKGPMGMVAAFVAAQVARNAVMPFNYPFDTVVDALCLSLRSLLPRGPTRDLSTALSRSWPRKD